MNDYADEIAAERAAVESQREADETPSRNDIDQRARDIRYPNAADVGDEAPDGRYTPPPPPTLDELRQRIAAGEISHTRAGDRHLRGLVLVYQHAPPSPTGVTLWCSFDESPEIDAILRGGLSPLSPTEGR